MAAGEARPVTDDEQDEPVRRALVPVAGVTPRTAPGTVSAPGSAGVTGDGAAPAPVPDAADTARALGLCVVEVLTGGREVDSIARWITEDVQRHLLHRAAVAARARSVGRGSRARPLVQVGSVRICEPAPGVAEAAVVVHTRSHARAVALRLELRQGRWRATAVGVL
ncbi:Rv3235 family protein [Curtobacterium oceanosedimentum]|uniref:Rv3235 family protein n=1 Tax=Curtobacterium oceanosedimentum TaxID=465820 RepID=UPI000A659775|nr:Rv3235 family protein [Curtobacterium oceanosedimentum]